MLFLHNLSSKSSLGHALEALTEHPWSVLGLSFAWVSGDEKGTPLLGSSWGGYSWLDWSEPWRYGGLGGGFFAVPKGGGVFLNNI